MDAINPQSSFKSVQMEAKFICSLPHSLSGAPTRVIHLSQQQTGSASEELALAAYYPYERSEVIDFL